MPDFFVFALLFLVVFLSAVVFLLLKKISSLEEKTESLLFDQKSQSVRFGKMSEQFMPFMESFPFNAGSFRFIGTPIDGIAFEDNEIVFCEFKTGKSFLSEKQKKIRDLVESKKIRWAEIRVS